MDINQLKSFISIVENGSITRAAEQLYISQPALSKRLNALESELQCRLIARGHKKPGLTHEGKVFLPKAYRILHEIENSKREIRNLKQSISGELRIATSHHIGIHHLPPLLKSYKNRYPSVELRLFFLESEKALQQLRNDKFDCALITLPERVSAQFRFFPIWHDPLFLCYAPSHPLAENKQSNIQHLADYPAILPPAHSSTRNIIEHFFYQNKLKLDNVMESNYLETIKMMVDAGLGWGFLPKTLINPEWHIVDTQVKFYRNLGIITDKEMTSSNAAKAFWQHCCNKKSSAHAFN